MKRSKQLKTAAIGLFIAVGGVCYSFFLPKEETRVEITRGDTDVTAESLTSTPVPTPTVNPEITGGGEQGESGEKTVTERADGETWKNAGKSSIVNINTANKEELMTLPGIGESRAAWIIEYRNKNGPFRKKEDIMQVKGIKDGIFAKIKDRISVE